MKVSVVAPFLPSPGFPYAGVFIANQMKALLSLGTQVTAVSFVPQTPWPLPHLTRRWRAFSTIPARYVWHGVSIEGRRYITLPRSMTLGWAARQMHHSLLRYYGEGDRPDIVHAHFAFPTGYAAVRAARDLGIPAILTVHGSDIHTLPVRRPRLKGVIADALSSAHRVLAVSRDLEQSARLLAPKAHLMLHRVGVDTAVFAPGSAHPERGLGVEGPVVLYVGNLLRAKGLLSLVRSIGLVPRCRLAIIGDGPIAPDILRLSRRLGVADRVHLLGRKPPDHIPDYLRAADVVVLPSYAEGLPTVCVEALACGRPVVATRVGGIPEIVEHGVSGFLCDPGRPDQLAAHISTLLDNSNLRMTMGREGRARVEKDYDLYKNAATLRAIYLEVLS